MRRLERLALETAVAVLCRPDFEQDPPSDRCIRSYLIQLYRRERITRESERAWLRHRVRELVARPAAAPRLLLVAGGLAPSALQRVRARFQASRPETQAPPGFPGGDPDSPSAK